MFKTHLKVLGLNPSYTEQQLKKAYYKNALLHHPDKKEIKDDSEFKKINTAYQYLKQKLWNADETLKVEPESLDKVFTKSFFMEYIKTVMRVDSETVFVIESILNKTNKISSYMMETMNIKHLQRMEKFLKQYKSNCKSLYKTIQHILQNYKRDNRLQVYNIKATLNDLFYSNIYVLEHDKEKYYIPLWYHELEYNDFMVNIHLDLSSNVIVDNENNIQVYINLQDIENTFDISETSSTDVSCNKINKYSYTHRFTETIEKVIELQDKDIIELRDNICDNITYTFKNEGILKINTEVEDIFEIKNGSDNKSDIFFILYNRKC
jgi:hypothetical protein